MCEKQDSFMIVFRVKRFIEHYLLVNAVSCTFTTTVNVVFISFVKTQTSVQRTFFNQIKRQFSLLQYKFFPVYLLRPKIIVFLS